MIRKASPTHGGRLRPSAGARKVQKRRDKGGAARCAGGGGAYVENVNGLGGQTEMHRSPQGVDRLPARRAGRQPVRSRGRCPEGADRVLMLREQVQHYLAKRLTGVLRGRAERCGLRTGQMNDH